MQINNYVCSANTLAFFLFSCLFPSICLQTNYLGISNILQEGDVSVVAGSVCARLYGTGYSNTRQVQDGKSPEKHT